MDTAKTIDRLRLCCVCHRELNGQDLAFGPPVPIERQNDATHGYCVEHFIRTTDPGDVVDLIERAVECSVDLGLLVVWGACDLKTQRLDLFLSLDSATKAQKLGSHGPAFKFQVKR